jgi:hypothetical protein
MIEGFQKMSKVYDSLMKSGKFDLMDYEKLYLRAGRGFAAAKLTGKPKLVIAW